MGFAKRHLDLGEAELMGWIDEQPVLEHTTAMESPLHNWAEQMRKRREAAMDDVDWNEEGW